MQPTVQMHADALRITLQDLDEAIRNCRSCIRKDHPRKSEFLTEYLDLLRSSHSLKDRLQAASNIHLGTCAAHLPMPFREQVMDHDPIEKFRRSWEASAAVKINAQPLLMAAE